MKTTRTTLNLDKKLIQQASQLTKISEKTSLIHVALRTLIAQSAQIELSRLRGCQKSIRQIKRRRMK